MPPVARAKELPRRSSGGPAASPLAKYERVRELGRGSYGIVWLMRRRTDRRLLAMKTVLLPPLACHEEKAIAERRQAIREAEILQMMESPHLVQYAEAVLAPASTAQPQSELNILTEYCDAGDLSAHLRKIGGGRGLPERSVWGFAVAILLGVSELHSRQILHRDLKPANVFLTRADHRARSQSRGRGARSADALQPAADASGLAARVRSVGCNGIAGDFWVRVGDLGLARAMTGSHPLASTMVGSPLYCAPEIFEGTPYGEKADIYSFGVCVYELMHGRPPYGDVQNVGALVRQVLNLDGTQPRLSMDPCYSEELRSFVDACLARSADQRPTASELMIRLPRAYAVRVPTRGRCESVNTSTNGSSEAANLADTSSVEQASPQTPRQARRSQTPSPSPHARQFQTPPQQDQRARSPATHRGMTRTPSSPATPVNRGMTRSPSSPATPVANSPQVVPARTPSPHVVQRSRSSPRLGSARTPSPCGFRGARLAGPDFRFQPPRRASKSVARTLSLLALAGDATCTAANAGQAAEQQQECGGMEYKAPTMVDSPKPRAVSVTREATGNAPTSISLEKSVESSIATPSTVEIGIDTLTLKVDIPLAAAPLLPTFSSASPSIPRGNPSRSQSLDAERKSTELGAEPASAREKSRPTSQPPMPAKRSIEFCVDFPARPQRRPTLAEHSSPQRDSELCIEPTSARAPSRSQLGEASICSLAVEIGAEEIPLVEKGQVCEQSPCSLGRTTSSNPWDAMRLRHGVSDVKPAGPQQKNNGKAYVAKAREYWKKWRRDRQEAKANENRAGNEVRAPGRADGRAVQKGSAREVPSNSPGGVDPSKQGLEVRGIAHPRSVAPVASPATPAGRRGARGSLVAARALYTPPGRRGKVSRV